MRLSAGPTAGLFIGSELGWPAPAAAVPAASGLSDPALQPKFVEHVANALDPTFRFKGNNDVYAGMAGFYFVRDDVDTGKPDNRLGLPVLRCRSTSSAATRVWPPRPPGQTPWCSSRGRHDVVFDFSTVPAGSRVIMENIGGDAPFGGAYGTALDADDFFPDRQTDRIMAFDVSLPLDAAVPDNFDPAAIAGPGPLTGPVANTRKVAVFEGMDEYGRFQPLLGTANRPPMPPVTR